VVYLNTIMSVAYSVLIGATKSFSLIANVNGQPITLTASYSSGTVTLTGSFTLQTSTNSLQIVVYFGDSEVDNIQISQPVSAGSYTLVYALTILDGTNIINNAIGYSVTSQLSSVSISTNANSYYLTVTGSMLTFFLAYSSYPSGVSITVTFTLTNNSTVTGSYNANAPALPSGYSEYVTFIPVTFY